MPGPLRFDRIRETSIIEGTGTLTLLGAVTGGYSFSSALANGDVCYFTVESIDDEGLLTGPNELVLGAYGSGGNTLTRATVRKSSNSNNLVNFTPGLKLVTLVEIAKNKVTNEVPSGTINGTNPNFTLAHSPLIDSVNNSNSTLVVFKNGLRQKIGMGNDYTLSTNTITFLSGAIPSGGDQLLADYEW